MSESFAQYGSPYGIVLDPISSINTNELSKLELSSTDKAAIVSMVRQFMQNIPDESQQKYYKVSFPEGLPNTLSVTKNGDLSTIIRDPKTGKIVGHATLQEATSVAQVSNAFALMAAATNQYYLTEINDKLEVISQKLDHILEFLYGDKKAELLAEISFSKYAYENYSSISRYEPQVIATINSLQDGRKVAIKDIEFYIADLNYIANADYRIPGELDKNVERALQICRSIEMSTQLYTMNCLLEVYYSQNANLAYIEYLKNDIVAYIEKCDKRMLQDLSRLGHMLENDIKNPLMIATKGPKAKMLKEINNIMDGLQSKKIGEKQKELLNALEAVTRKAEYVLSDSGEVYLADASE